MQTWTRAAHRREATTDAFPAVYVWHGDDPIHSSPQTPQSLAILDAVVLVHGDGESCSGVYVVDADSSTWLLTAAHCVFQADAEGHMGGLASQLKVPSPTTVDVGAARVSRAFRDCAGQGGTYDICVNAGAADVALVPVTGALGNRTPWSLCTAPPPSASFYIFGFGLTETGRPKSLRRGLFAVRTNGGSGAWLLTGQAQTATDVGDSGGPIITAEDNALIASGPPHVCFVASGRGIDGSVQTANVQPVWGIW